MKKFSQSQQVVVELENGKTIRTSALEKQRTDFLKAQQQQGIIKNLKSQVVFQMMIPVKYIADFTYEMNGKYIVEDVKGRIARTYVRNRKYMKKIHNIHIHEVTRYDDPCTEEERPHLQSDEVKKSKRKHKK